MKHTIQIKTTVAEAEKFVRQLSTQGYTAHQVRDCVHFVNDETGETSINYEVNLFEDEAFIGIRPS